MWRDDALGLLFVGRKMVLRLRHRVNAPTRVIAPLPAILPLPIPPRPAFADMDWAGGTGSLNFAPSCGRIDRIAGKRSGRPKPRFCGERGLRAAGRGGAGRGQRGYVPVATAGAAVAAGAAGRRPSSRITRVTSRSSTNKYFWVVLTLAWPMIWRVRFISLPVRMCEN